MIIEADLFSVQSCMIGPQQLLIFFHNVFYAPLEVDGMLSYKIINKAYRIIGLKALSLKWNIWFTSNINCN